MQYKTVLLQNINEKGTKMESQCPECGNLMEVDSIWIGQETECPFCQKTIIIQPLETQTPPPINRNSTEATPQKNTAAMILGIVSCIMWLLPIIGGPIAITGLILSIMKKYTTGLILNIVGLILTIINAIAGAIMFS